MGRTRAGCGKLANLEEKNMMALPPRLPKSMLKNMKWKNGMERRGLKVNMGKIKVIGTDKIRERIQSGK